MACGVEAMAGFGIIDLALHDVDEEADNVPAVVGLLADDVGEGVGVFFSMLFCGERMFYRNGCGRLGLWGEWRGGGWGLVAETPGKTAMPPEAPNPATDTRCWPSLGPRPPARARR